MNIAKLHEAIARAIPDAEALVYGDRRMTWGETDDCTRRLNA
jgi:acyl-CoA synthetase (AMP-forming)/AMP-acid ligase II